MQFRLFSGKHMKVVIDVFPNYIRNSKKYCQRKVCDKLHVCLIEREWEKGFSLSGIFPTRGVDNPNL